ncbi:MAG: SWIM zinc finger family protein [Polyangiaceae bacterium]|nr:SWIM zinc finger family protein [Polyangiaceae bacterium]
MRRWGYSHRWVEPPPKLPPPARGIKVKKTGTTWWGQRWIEALEQRAGYSNRLPRGRTYARAGRVHDLDVKAGEVTAHVTGSRPRHYVVTIRLAPFKPATWAAAIAAMAEKAQFSAELLGGAMPAGIDEAFRSAGTSLFPDPGADLRTACSCPDSANPCKHVAATHYVLGEAFDRDPFLLFELRGRTRDEVLASLHAARGGAAPEAPAGRRAGKDKEERAREAAAVSLHGLSAADYDAWRGPPPSLSLKLERPTSPGALLRQLGTPPRWSMQASPAELLEPLVEAAAARALELAMTVEEEGTGRGAGGSARRGPARGRQGFDRKTR